MSTSCQESALKTTGHQPAGKNLSQTSTIVQITAYDTYKHLNIN